MRPSAKLRNVSDVESKLGHTISRNYALFYWDFWPFDLKIASSVTRCVYPNFYFMHHFVIRVRRNRRRDRRTGGKTRNAAYMDGRVIIFCSFWAHWPQALYPWQLRMLRCHKHGADTHVGFLRWKNYPPLLEIDLISFVAKFCTFLHFFASLLKILRDFFLQIITKRQKGKYENDF